MADISKIKASNGTTYDLKDAEARGSIGTSTSRSYTAQLTVAGWNGSGSNFTQSISGFDPALRANHPPIITCTDTDKTSYNYLVTATATPGGGITFQAHTKPTVAINLIVIDLG